jgi:hypothetical protein
MARNVLKWLVGIGACVIVAGVAFAQVSDHFDLSWHLLSNGGGRRSSATYQLDDSLGQLAGSVSGGPTYEIRPGFWQGDTAAGQQGDDYEVDDTCGAAAAIATNGTVQTHTFHDAGDYDWVKFTAVANKSYVLRVGNVGANVDAVVMLFDACDEPAFESEDNAFGSTVELEWNCTASGEYYLAVLQHDPAVYGQGTNYDLSVTADAVPPTAPRNIRVDPLDRALTVQWSRSVEPDVAGYAVRWGTHSGGPYSYMEVDGADNTYYQIPSLINGQAYYIVLTARDFSGNWSAYSVEVGGIPAPGQDTTVPSPVIEWPVAGDVYTTTASVLSVGGHASDTGDNLSHVEVNNAANGATGYAYNLAGATAAFMVESIPVEMGANQLHVTAYDAVGNAGEAVITVRRISGLAGAVIIVGGHNNSRSVQSNIDYATNRAFRVFRAAGYGVDQIRYLSPTPQYADTDTIDDVTATTSADNLHAALQWAAGQVGPGVPLYMYLMDHGGIEAFCADGCTLDGAVSPQELDTWLRELEDASGCNNINIIIEACHSGSFIDRVETIAQSISKAGRVVITSTDRDHNAYASASGAYFSDAFFSAVAESSSLLSSFNQAKAAVALNGVNQVPWLDDNGDGLSNAYDGTLASGRYIASYFGTLLPEVTNGTLSVNGTLGTIAATVARGDAPVELVWAAVYPPSFQEPAETTLDLGVPLVRLEPDPAHAGQYAAEYNGFGEEGDYRVVIYVEDEAGNQALPYLVGAGGTQRLYLPLMVQRLGP